MKKKPPIPKKALVNSVTYQAYVSNGGEGSTYATSVTLANVKVDEQKQFTYSTNGKEVIGNGMLFYDLTNSSGLTAQPVNESKVTFNGKTYTIKNTDILRANNETPHHYEILLK